MTAIHRFDELLRRGIAAMLLILPLLWPHGAEARGYGPQGLCGDYARVDITTPAGTCVALLADEAQGLRFPRRILEIAPGRFWIVDMGSWEPHRGRLLEMTLPASGAAPRRAAITVLADKLDRPLGLAVGPDAKIYIGEAGVIWRTPIPAPGQPVQRETVIDKLPDDGAHPLKELAFGPGGKLYVNVGSLSDACRDGPPGGVQTQALPCPETAGNQPRAAVYEATLDGPAYTLKSFKPFATGLRNSVALAVLPAGPAKGTVLQGENSIDYPDAGEPSEELNRLQAGRHYGWPYCVANAQPARGYEKRYDCGKTEKPLQLLAAHAAPLNLLVGSAGSPYAGQLLVALHGYKSSGHRIVAYTLNAQGLPASKPAELLAGWAARPGVRPLGKPTGMAIDRNGRLLVVEDINRTVLMVLPIGAMLAPSPTPTLKQ